LELLWRSYCIGADDCYTDLIAVSLPLLGKSKMLTINIKTVRFNDVEIQAGSAAYIRENIDNEVLFSVVGRLHNGQLVTVKVIGSAYREGDHQDLCNRLDLENKARKLANMLNS
jgi:hypothetical protein